MLKNITITLSEEAAAWVRRKATKENTSVSRWVGRMIENQMRLTDEYGRAYEAWKAIQPLSAGSSASKRMRRDQAHERA